MDGSVPTSRRPVIITVVPDTRERFEAVVRWLEEQATRESAKEFLFNVNADLAAVKAEITLAKRNAAAYGQFKDPEWLRKAESRRAYLGRLAQRVQSELGRMTATEKEGRMMQSKEDSETFARQFMFTARELLPEDLYAKVMAETQRRVGR